MAEKQKFYYKTCRKLAGLTQEQASELLCVEVRSLSGYENGAKVPDDIVARMADGYNVNSPKLYLYDCGNTRCSVL